MRFARSLPALPLLLSASIALAQEPLRRPLDGPETFRNPQLRDIGAPRPDPSEIAATIRALGGELRDVTHDCGAATNRTYGNIAFLVRACSWGGRHPALLFEPADPDDGTLVVLASNGNRLEVLYDDAAPASLVETLSGLLKDDFDQMFWELSSPDQ